MDATIIILLLRSFQTELFSRVLPSTYAGHVNLAEAKPWRFMPKWKDGSTVEFIIFRVKDFLSAEVPCHILINIMNRIIICMQSHLSYLITALTMSRPPPINCIPSPKS